MRTTRQQIFSLRHLSWIKEELPSNVSLSGITGDLKRGRVLEGKEKIWFYFWGNMEEFSPCPCIPKASLAFLLVEKKESTKILLFERDNSCLCIPISWHKSTHWVTVKRNTETTVVPFKWQYLTAPFFQFPSKIQTYFFFLNYN